MSILCDRSKVLISLSHAVLVKFSSKLEESIQHVKLGQQIFGFCFESKAIQNNCQPVHKRYCYYMRTHVFTLTVKCVPKKVYVIHRTFFPFCFIMHLDLRFVFLLSVKLHENCIWTPFLTRLVIPLTHD